MVADTGSGRTLTYRADERFAFASTNKTFIAAATLRTDFANLDRIVHFSKQDLLDYAPITSHHVGTGMTVRALLDAMLRYSDNTAANLLVDRLGGPDAIERFIRSLGDDTTSVDRTEPTLNTATPGDDRDTSTPRAFEHDLAAVLTGSALSPSQRNVLDSTMQANTTGTPYIRAGVPKGWTVADKTGSGGYGTRNDIAVVTPQGGKPIVIVLMSGTGKDESVAPNDLLADATRLAVKAIR